MLACLSMEVSPPQTRKGTEIRAKKATSNSMLWYDPRHVQERAIRRWAMQILRSSLSKILWLFSTSETESQTLNIEANTNLNLVSQYHNSTSPTPSSAQNGKRLVSRKANPIGQGGKQWKDTGYAANHQIWLLPIYPWDYPFTLLLHTKWSRS